MYYYPLSGSAKFFMGLLALVPELVERTLLPVLPSIKWVCQTVHGSATHDPQVRRESSAAYFPIYSMGLPDCSWVC